MRSLVRENNADEYMVILTEASYRFCGHTPGANVVLTGTGSLEHLRENIRSINGPPLPLAARARLARLFGRVSSISGD